MTALNHTPLDTSKLIPPSFRPSPEAAPVRIETPEPVAEATPVPETAPQPEQQEQTVEQSAEHQPPDVSQYSVPRSAERPPWSAEHQPADVSQYIQEKKDEIEVPPDLQKYGLTPVQTTQSFSYQNVQLPLSDEKVLEGLDQPVTSSYRWLAELAKFMLFQAHLQLKKVHGRVVRIIKR